MASAAFVAAVAACGHRPPAPATVERTEAPPRPGVAQNAAAMDDVKVRVEQFAAERDRAADALPPLRDKAERDEIVAHERALASRLAAERGRTNETIFTARTETLFRRLITEAVRQPGGRATRASVLDENPGAIALAPNRPYPDGIVVSTVPPEILKALPALPPDVEYRFVGKHLIIRDTRANFVVDVLKDALP